MLQHLREAGAFCAFRWKIQTMGARSKAVQDALLTWQAADDVAG